MPDSALNSIAVPSSLSGFPEEIEAALSQVGDQCGAIIEAVCGSGARAKDVADRFGVHAKLGWQLWNVAYSNPLSALRFLPNDHGVDLWRRSAAARGVPSELLDGFRLAIDNVRAVIDHHAEDREMFEMLVDARAASDEDAAQKWRKQAFIGNGFMFGARAKCVLATAIFFPSERPHFFSLVRLHGLVDLIRTRVGVRWPLASLVVQQTDGKLTIPGREALVPGSENPVPLVPSHCFPPSPAVERRTDGTTVFDELLPAAVGLTGAQTLFTGEILRDVGPTHGHDGADVAHFGSGVRTPSELLVHDHIVHKSLFPGARRELRVFSELVSPTTRDDRDRMDVTEKLEHLGQGLLRVRTADVPDYAELLSLAFERIGFDPNEFDVFRVRIPYPPIPASVMVRHELPPPPIS